MTTEGKGGEEEHDRGYYEDQLRARGGKVLEEGWYVLYNVAHSRLNRCTGPMTYADADSYVRRWRSSSNPCGCYCSNGIVRMLFRNAVYKFDNESRAMFYERDATEDDKKTVQRLEDKKRGIITREEEKEEEE